MAIELHKKQVSRKTNADPYLRTTIRPDCDPKNGVVAKRFLALNALLANAANARMINMVMVAVSMASIRVFLRL